MKKYLFPFCFLIILFSCKKTQDDRIKNLKFVRVWFDTIQMMPFKAKLEIRENNTFTYKSAACQSRSESSGTWKIDNDTIILKSVKPKGCLFQNRFDDLCIDINDEKYYENNKTIKNCEPSGIEPDYEIFLNEKFIIRNDTLIHTNKVKNNCSEIGIAFSTKAKIRRHISK